MKKSNAHCFVQVQTTKDERQMLREVAEHRDLTMSQQVRHWIKDAHKRMEKNASAA